MLSLRYVLVVPNFSRLSEKVKNELVCVNVEQLWLKELQKFNKKSKKYRNSKYIAFWTIKSKDFLYRLKGLKFSRQSLIDTFFE